MLFYCLALFLGVFVLDCNPEARYSFDAPERSRIIVVTDFLNSSNGEKVFSSLGNRGLADAELVVLQRDGTSSFHGSFNVWSRGKKRALWQITEKELLPWLLVEKPPTLISVTQSTDIPKILISARRKGLLPFTRELLIWVIQDSGGAVKGVNGIILTSPGDLDSQSSFLDTNHFISKKVHFISARDLENAVVEVLQTRKRNVPRRQRRAVPNPNANVTSSSIVASTNSSGMTVQPTVSPKLNVTYLSVAASNYSSGIAVQLTPSPNENITKSNIAASTSSSVFPVHLTPSPYVNVSSSSIVASTNSSGIAVQPSPSNNVSVASLSMASTNSSTMAVLRTSSPKVNTTNSSVAASSSSTGITIQLTPSPYVNASSSVVVVSTNSSGIEVEPSPIHNVSVTSSSMASTNSSTMPVVPTSIPKANVISSSIAASTSSSGIPIHLTPSPYVSASSSSIVASTNSSGIVVQPSPSHNVSVISSSMASTNSSTMAVLPTSSPKVNITNSSIAASTSSSGIPIHLTPSPYVNTTSSSIAASTNSSGIAVQPSPSHNVSEVSSIMTSTNSSTMAVLPTSSPKVNVSNSSSAASTSSSGIPIHLTPSSYVNTTSSSIAASTNSSGIAVQVTSTISESVSAVNSSIVAVASSSGVVVQSTFFIISSSATISPSPTERQPTFSSSEVIVTERPPVSENQTVIIVFEGNCKDIVNDANAKEQFRNEVVEVVRAELGTKKSYIHVSDIQCGSIEVTVTVIGASGVQNVSHQLKNLVEKGNITVTFNGKTYTAKEIKQVQPKTTQVPTTTAPKNEVAFILYITFGSLIGLIFIVGVIVLVARCRKDRSQGSFYLTADTNYELRRFQGIPRARDYSRVNYYGNPVELDATAADPYATSDEFQAQPGRYPYNKGSSLDRVKPITAASNDEKFNYSAAGLPEWKNLPKLSKSEVARDQDPKRSVPPSSGSIGSRKELLAHESETLQEDPTLAYDNPVVTIEDDTSGLEMEADDNPRVTTFSESTCGQEKKVSVETAFDKEGFREDDSS